MALISINTVKDTCGLATTLEERKLLPYYESAEITLNRIVGDTIFARLEAAVATPSSDLPAEALITDYITQFLSWFTYERSVPMIYAEPSRNGIHYKADATTVQSDTAHMRQLMKVAGDQKDLYQKRLIDYLKVNSDTGEEWAAYNTDTDSANDRLMESSRNTYGGIITKRSRWQNQPGKTGYGYPHQHNDCCE